ncbi:hypothetical protein Kpol_1066p10 [Vanderwaltozyma polyspora DSM 70294]|uniref:MICOS complex subunit MIC12 n=1 Tax=Vanderwaltozyma polyspora (strain ATCC 22028 / DSM 70294 / BCRC 21397 / CBS 2163 / NBRC 10782 / NRRL Y-8283 / UCD 57-17) TaxID=436907 RepID=MIC12_VANPO|nr:uncharacterized protein Kpol_1066p10 [Vanderwaltozyma polyspora DSM 70294]A7TMN2.1 RecName: Full=MICOS complex subunit MIC12; AltName: Full=Altered inheritance of mitochondria protein 5, mitochondrial; AltName: Full=Found in mitochondrial proteome protein 51 [Vanderwaltozyma polyspora DSM 70294]EDO16446.1 hypothetical protein Kpol_1066p10 [Vanderwaltozyma polyspora DSM 70294]
MSKIWKFTSFATISSVAAASLYLYAIDKNGYYYEKSKFKQVTDRVRKLIDGDETFKYVTIDDFVSGPTQIQTRSRGETFKDLWNAEVRRTAQWIYSLGGR